MKMNMKHLYVQLLHLPDEILLIILKKLDNVEVLYSLINVNKRLNQIARDPIFNTHITLMEHYSSYHLMSPLSDVMLNRFCSQILPEIHCAIKRLSLETLSMERILLAADYPNLNQLDIFIMNLEIDIDLFTDKSSLIHIFQNQITTLSVIGKQVMHNKVAMNMRGNLFVTILRLFTNLLHFKFYQSNDGAAYMSFSHQSPSLFCSTLVELHIHVYLFDDCLYLLDDNRLNQLRTLFVNAFYIFPHQSTVYKKEKLPNLKHCSLMCINETFVYNDVIVPHLQRMFNLEKLALYLVIDCFESFIDGNNIQKNIVNYMPRLNEFVFDIRSSILLNGETHLPTNQDIQRTMTHFQDLEITSCVDYFPKAERGQCHIYSHPYTMIHYENITNHFPGGIFQYVQDVSLFDERPFEHEFFIRIAQAFPLLKKLTVTNSEAQYQKSNDDNQNFSIIEYPYLTELHLPRIHDDYAEQFLFNIKTSLPNDIRFWIDYDVLERVTHNFTRDATRVNYSKVKKRLCTYSRLDLSKYL